MRYSVHPHVFGFASKGSSQAWSVLASAHGARGLGDRVPWPQQAHDDPDPAALFAPLRAMRTQSALDSIQRAFRGSGKSIIASFRGAVRPGAERGRTPRVATLSLLFDVDAFAAVAGFPEVLFWLDDAGSLPASLAPELAFPEGGWFERLNEIAIRGFAPTSTDPVHLESILVPESPAFRKQCTRLLRMEIERLATLVERAAGGRAALTDQLTALFCALAAAHQKRGIALLPAELREGRAMARLAFLALPFADRVRVAVSDEVEAAPPYEPASVAEWDLARSGGPAVAVPPSSVIVTATPDPSADRGGARFLADAIGRGGNDLSLLMSPTSQRLSLLAGDHLQAEAEFFRWRANWGLEPAVRMAADLFGLERIRRGSRARLSAVGLVLAEALHHEYRTRAPTEAAGAAISVLTRIAADARTPVLRGLVRRLITRRSEWHRRTAALIRCGAALEDPPLVPLTEIDRLHSRPWERTLLATIAGATDTSLMLFEACTRWIVRGDENALAFLPFFLRSRVSPVGALAALEGIRLDQPAMVRWAATILEQLARGAVDLPYDRLLADWLLPETERLGRPAALIRLLKMEPWPQAAIRSLSSGDLARYVGLVDPPGATVRRALRSARPGEIACDSLVVLLAHISRTEEALEWLGEGQDEPEVIEAVAVLLASGPDPTFASERTRLAEHLTRWFEGVRGSAVPKSAAVSKRAALCLGLLRALSATRRTSRVPRFVPEVRVMLTSGLFFLAENGRLAALEPANLHTLVAQLEASDARLLLDFVGDLAGEAGVAETTVVLAQGAALSALRSFAEAGSSHRERSARGLDAAYAVWVASRFDESWAVLDQLETADPDAWRLLEREWLRSSVPISLWLEVRRRGRRTSFGTATGPVDGSLFLISSSRSGAWMKPLGRV